MRTIRFLLQKEFRQILRNRTILAVVLMVPIVQLLILPLAADYEVKNVSLCIVDHDHSTYSQKLIAKITASGYFKLVDFPDSYNAGLSYIEKDKADVILEIPSGFERNLIRDDSQKLFVSVNAINGVKANLGGAYVLGIIREFNSGISAEWLQPPAFSSIPIIDVAITNWFNPYMNYKIFMVPGILAVLVTMMGGYVSALNIVKEKELGTIEQMNVSPIRKHHFILGKLIPFWILGMVVLSIGLTVGFLVYGIVPEGKIALIYLFAAIYLVSILGLGFLVSTYSETQQQAMFLSFFFIMIFIMMSGLFTSIDSMPQWTKVITWFNPVTYFIQVMRMIVLKGSGFTDILPHLLKVAGIGFVLNFWAIRNYKKTS
jgi:ABC-2 type transport system permease protein